MDQQKAQRLLALLNSDMLSEMVDILTRLVESNTPKTDTDRKPDVCREYIKDMKTAVKQALVNLNIMKKSDFPHKGKLAQWGKVYDEVRRIVDPHTAEQQKNFNSAVRWHGQPILPGYTLCKT
uniref:Uncharacterized protein n=1 Tax=viral metagenome TaxID=1070528 RepID=A0A6C0FEF5_9ZZZZ|tara:strand:+ start:24314 stop:24682 length:369 start_codon:yes stop_codon:yes gene_type:complete